MKEGKLEIQWRWEKQSEMIDRDGAAERLAEMIVQERADGKRFANRRQGE